MAFKTDTASGSHKLSPYSLGSDTVKVMLIRCGNKQAVSLKERNKPL